MVDIEEWRPVVSYSDVLEVSNWGNIRNIETKFVYKLRVNDRGYLVVSVRPYGEVVTLVAHREVAKSFIDEPTEELLSRCSPELGEPVVRHLDNNKLNNTPNNLFWGTIKDNAADFKLSENFDKAHKLQAEKIGGTNNPKAKLSEDQVREIRDRYKPRCKVNGATALGLEFGVGRHRISDIVNRKSYKNVE